MTHSPDPAAVSAAAIHPADGQGGREMMFDDLAQLDVILAETSVIANGFVQSAAERPVICTTAERPVICHDLSGIAPSRHQMPEKGCGTMDALRAVRQDILPLLAASVGPRYLGFVTGGTTPAALAGDWLTAAFDQNACVPDGSVTAAIEDQVIDWICDMAGLPAGQFAGVITTGATVSNLLGLVSGRQWCGQQMGVDVDADGASSLPDFTVFAACAHASMIKDLSITGIGRNRIVKIATLPGSEQTDLDDLAAQLGQSPSRAKMVVASAGTVNATDFDDLAAIADICKRHGAWLHVDAAFGLFAALDDRRADLLRGLELADSITSDGHKWLNVPYDCGIFLTRHIRVLETACRAFAPYLESNTDESIYMNRGLENSRRFRAFPLWLSMLAYGRQGMAAIIRANCDQAQQFAAWLRGHERLVLMREPRLNVVMFAGPGTDAENRAMMARINASGQVFVTPTVYGGRFGFRAAFSNWRTRDADIGIICQAIETALAG